MKKLLSTIISIAILATSAAVPVFADEVNTEVEEIAAVETVEEEIVEEEIYEEEIVESFEFSDYISGDYDIERLSLTYDDGATINDIDGSAALKIDGEEEVRLFTLSDNTTMIKEFFLTFDFRMDSAEDGTVPGIIGINRSGKVGPMFSYDAASGQFRTQTGSSSFQNLGAINPDEWYTAELEGKMVVTGAKVIFRLYNYVDGVKTLVNTVDGLNLRQFYAGSSNGYPDYFRGYKVSMDNVKLISEYPDVLTLSSTADEIDAGSIAALDYVATRQDIETTKYSVTWSVWDETGVNEITDGSAAITADGILSADIHSPSQTVTVKATADLEGKELVGEYQVNIKAVSTENEKFDSIVIDGAMGMKAGTSSTFTFTATKGGEDVTSTLTSEDVIWSVYDYADLEPNSNARIKAENGVLTVEDGVLPQTVTLRASSTSGKVYGSKAISILVSDSQIETLLTSNACEETIETADRVESIDGSKAYAYHTTTRLNSFGNTGEYVLTELDIKFDAADSGFTLIRADGSYNSCFRFHNNTISMQTGSSKWTSLMAAEADKWYHLEILYSSTNADASCNIYEYNEDGTLGEPKACYEISRRNGKEYGNIEILAGTTVDNIKVSSPLPDAITITAPGQFMFAGETAQYSATATRNSLPLKNFSGLKWEVLDASDLPIIDGSVTVSDAGLLTSDPMVPEQTVTVRVSSGDASAGAKVTIQSSEIFSVTNIGINEAATEIVKLYVDKNFYYDDEVSFIIAIKDEDGRLAGVKLISTYGDRLNIGSNELTTNLVLPEGFSADTYTVEVMVWTAL